MQRPLSDTTSITRVIYTTELLEKVVEYLPPLDAIRLAPTLRPFAMLLGSIAPSWSRLDLTSRPFPPIQSYDSLFRMASNIIELKLDCGCHFAQLSRILAPLRQLQDLRLTNPSSSMLEGISSLSSLTSLKIQDRGGNHPSLFLDELHLPLRTLWITDSNVAWSSEDSILFALCCRRMGDTLQDVMAGRLSADDAISCLEMTTWKELKRLSLIVHQMSDTLVDTIKAHVPFLDELSLRDESSVGGSELTDGALQTLAARGQLRKVNLTRTNGLFNCSDVGATYLAMTSTNTLEYVTIAQMRKLSDVTVAAFLKCPHLRQLHFQGCRSMSGHAFSPVVLGIQRLPVLTSVNLSHCTSIGDESVAALCDLCPNLTELNLTSTSTSDDSMASIAQLVYLRQLVLNGCHITDQGLISFGAEFQGANRHPSLRKLALRGCNAVSDAGLIDLCDHRVIDKLTCLDLTSITLITDQSLFRVLAVCSQLEELKLRNCAGLSFQVLDQLSKSPARRSLRVFDICRCEGMSTRHGAAGVDSITGLLSQIHCYPKLSHLYLGCGGLKLQAIASAILNYIGMHDTMPRVAIYTFPQVQVYHFDQPFRIGFDEEDEVDEDDWYEHYSNELSDAYDGDY